MAAFYQKDPFCIFHSDYLLISVEYNNLKKILIIYSPLGVIFHKIALPSLFNCYYNISVIGVIEPYMTNLIFSNGDLSM